MQAISAYALARLHDQSWGGGCSPWRVGHLSFFFFQGSPHSTCTWRTMWFECTATICPWSKCGSQPGRLCRIISGQLAVALFELEALQEAKNRSCKIIHQRGFVRLHFWTVTVLPLFTVMQPEQGDDRAARTGEQNTYVQWQSGRGHMFKTATSWRLTTYQCSRMMLCMIYLLFTIVLHAYKTLKG